MVIACERRSHHAGAAAEPPWLLPTSSISLDIEESRTEGVEVRIDPKSAALRAQRGWAEATMDDIVQRLKDAAKRGDSEREHSVTIDAAPDTPWFRVSAVLDTCEVWFHRRVRLKTDEQKIAIHLPPNRSWDNLPIPAGARIPLTIRFNPTTTAERPQGTWVLVNNHWSDLRSLRTRVAEAARHISHRPAVAILDIDSRVPAGEMATLLRILIEADIARYIEKLPEPSGDD